MFFSGCKIDNVLLKKFNIFSFCVQSIESGTGLEPPQRGGSSEYPQSMLDQKYEKWFVHPLFITYISDIGDLLKI